MTWWKGGRGVGGIELIFDHLFSFDLVSKACKIIYQLTVLECCLLNKVAVCEDARIQRENVSRVAGHIIEKKQRSKILAL